MGRHPRESLSANPGRGECGIIAAVPSASASCTTVTDLFRSCYSFLARGIGCGLVQVEAEGTEQSQQILFCDLDFTKVDEFQTNVPTALQKRPDIYSFGPASKAE